MSNTATGQVTSVEKRATRKPGTYLNFFTIGRDKYTTTFDPPGVVEGDYVEFTFDVEVNGQYENKVVKPKNIKKVDPPKQEAATSTNGVTMSSSDYWNNKEKRDIDADLTRRWNAARSTAVDLLKVAISAGVPLKSTNKKDTPDLDMIIGHCDTLTEMLFISGSNTEYMNQLLDLSVPINDAENVSNYTSKEDI